MSKALRAPVKCVLFTLQRVSNLIRRGHLVALFILIAILATVFAGKIPSSANTSGKKLPDASRAAKSANGSDRSVASRFSSKERLTFSADEEPQTLTTDKATYTPGETITFNGANWTPGEVITIVITPEAGGEGKTVQATADSSGSFTATSIMPDAPSSAAAAVKGSSAANTVALADEGGVYTATATGASSGAIAHTQFSRGQGDETDGDDPDLPAFMVGKVDKEDYLRRREEHIHKLRGIVPGKPFDPSWRGQAIREMNRREGRADRAGGANNSAAESSGASGAASLSGPSTPSSSTVWSNIGPNPLPNGQTFNTNNVPVSGRVTAIALHPTNSNIAYVGAAQGGVYRTLDGGATWTAIFDSAQSLAIGAIAIAPSQPSTIYVGTGEENFSCDSYFGVGVYRIDNADGASPTLSGPFNKDGTGTDQMSGRAIGKILIHPTNPDIIFVGTGGGIGGVACVNIPGVDSSATSLRPRGLWRSANASSANPTFERMTVATDNGGNRNVTDIEFEPGNPNIVFATVLGFSTAGSGGVWYSTNPYAASPTFTRTLAASSTSTSERFEISLNKTGSTVYLMTATSQASGTFKRGTYTAGSPAVASWSGALGTSGFCGGQCTYDMPVAVDPTNANIVYLGGPGDSSPAHILTKVTNATGTPTFTASQTGIHADEHAIEIDPNNTNILWTGNDGGIFKSNNAASSWNSLNGNGFVATQFQSLAVHSTDANFTIGGSQDNGTECLGPCGTFTGNTWNQADYGDGGFAVIDQSQSSLTTLNMYHTYYNQTNTLIGYAYVTSTANAKFSSNPIGNNWSFNGTGGSVSCTGGGGYACTEAVEFYMPMALGPGSPNPLYTGTDRLHRAATPGASNATVSQAPIVSGVPISAIGISPQNDSVRMVGLENGQVWRTMTGSSTLVNVTGTIPAGYISRAVIDPNNQNTAYVTLSAYFGSSTSHVYKTTNLSAGTPTWAGVDGGQIPDIPINAFVVDPSNSSFLYAGTDIGVYRSTDGGATWTSFSNGLPRVAVFDMAIQNSNRILRIATHGRGLWEIFIGTTGTLQGTITDAGTSNPINGATVTAGSNTATTNASGFYQFTNIATGTYSVTASAAGYNSNTVSGVTVNDSATTTQNIALTLAPTSGCLTDTSQANFQSGAASNVDLISSPGDVKLAAGAGTLDQQMTNVGSTGQAITTTTWEAQTFTPAVTGQLTQIDADLFCSACSGANPDITVEIRTTSANVPTSTVLASTIIPGFSSGTAFYSATFSSPASLTSGTKYAIVLRLLTNRATGTYAWLRSNSGQYSGGDYEISTNSGGSWTINAQDFGFKTYMSTGFVASGDLTSSPKDSNPLPSSTTNWTQLSWTASTPANTTVKFQLAGSNSALGPFNFVGPSGTSADFFTTSPVTGATLSQFNGLRYLKYKAYLSTTNSNATPTLNDVTVCFNVVGAQAATSLAVSAASGTYGGAANLSATLTSSGNPVSGKTIAFTLNGNSAGSAVTNGSGVATLNNASLSGINAGIYPSGVGASFAGDSNYQTSSSSNSLTVGKASSTTAVTCGAGPFTYDGTAQTPCSAVVTGAGGLNQTLTVSYSNNTNAGTATANASYPGDANHDGSSDSKNFTINKASSTTTIDCTTGAPFTYTGSAITPCTATATGAGGLNASVTPVNYANNVNAGSATASATYGGDANHNGSTGNGGFTINKASSTTTIDCTAGAPFTYTGSAITPCTATATGAGGLNASVTPVNYANNVNAGLATASATYGGDANHDGSTGNGGFTIDKASSSVTVNCPASETYTGSAIEPCTASFSGAGGLSGSLTPTYANNVNVGTATASASYAGDANHNGNNNSANFSITKATSSVTVNCPASETYTGSAIEPCTASFSGAGGLSGSLTPTYLNNVNVGMATASASYAGDANHDGSNNSANFAIQQASSTTNVTVTDATYDGSEHGGTASVTGAGGLSQSLDVTYTGRNGTIYGPTTTRPTNAGDYTASATFAGDNNHAGSSDAKNFTINRANATIAVTPYNVTYDGNPHTATGTAKDVNGDSLSGLDLSGTTHTNAGTYNGDAWTFTDTTGNYNNASGYVDDRIGQADSTTIVSVSNATFDGSPHGGTANVTGAGGLNQGLTVSYSGRNGTVYGPTTVAPTNAGDYAASASFGGDANHTGSSDSKNFAIAKANQTISFGTISPMTFGDGDFNVTATATSGLTVSLAVAGQCTLSSATSPATVHITGAGTCIVTASQGGSLNYNAADDVMRSFDIAKANQTINFGALANKTYGNADFLVSATATSQLAVSFAAAGNCTVSGSTVHITGAGSCTVTAAQVGDANYNPAPDVSRTFYIAKAASSTTVTCPASVIYNGSAQTPCTASVTGFGGLNQSLSVSYLNNIIAGTATASASYPGDANHNGSSDSRNFLILSAASSTAVSSSKNPSAYGDAVSFTATISPNVATGTVQFKIDGNNFGPPVAIVSGSATSGSTSSLTAGSHNVSAVYSGDNNFAGSTGNLTQIVARPVKITGGGSVGSAIHFGFNVKPVQDETSAKGFKGHVEFHDNGLAGSVDDLKFKSTSISTEYAVDNHHGTFTGPGTLNGASGYTFIATIEDNAKRGAGYDKFRIQIMNSVNALIYDSNTRSVNPDGTLIAGKVKIHYDKDDFNTSSLEGNGSFLSGSLNFDIDVETDGLGGFNAGTGVQFTDATNSYTLTSVSVDTMKAGSTVTVSGPALLNGVQGYKFQTDWDTGKLTLHLRIWDSAGKQIYDSKPSQLTSGTCAYIATN